MVSGYRTPTRGAPERVNADIEGPGVATCTAGCMQAERCGRLLARTATGRGRARVVPARQPVTGSTLLWGDIQGGRLELIALLFEYLAMGAPPVASDRAGSGTRSPAASPLATLLPGGRVRAGTAVSAGGDMPL